MRLLFAPILVHQGSKQHLDREEAGVRKGVGVKDPIRRTKFIPRVGNWENRAKRQSVALYGDYTPLAGKGPRRISAKGAKHPLSRPAGGGEPLEGGWLPGVSPANPVAGESPVAQEVAEVSGAAAGVATVLPTGKQEQHASKAADVTDVQQRWNARATEASDKLTTAVQSLINETALLRKDFSDQVVEFESLLSTNRHFIQQMDERIAALNLDEPAPLEETEVPAAPQDASGPRRGDARDVRSTTDAIPGKQVQALARAKVVHKGRVPTTAQGSTVRAPFSVKKVPSKWASAARREADRLGTPAGNTVGRGKETCL